MTAGQNKRLIATECKNSMMEIMSMDNPSFVNDFCFDDSNKHLFCASQNSKIHMWNISKRRLVSTFGSQTESVNK